MTARLSLTDAEAVAAIRRINARHSPIERVLHHRGAVASECQRRACVSWLRDYAARCDAATDRTEALLLAAWLLQRPITPPQPRQKRTTTKGLTP